MSGDWIKMRGNLWDDPRIGRICDLAGVKEATAIGALYWLWATADQHTSDGCMPGLSMQQIDRKTGVKGFAAALVDVGWLNDDPQGVVICHFEEHNGASAKKRAQTAKRVANSRSGNADETQDAANGNAPSVTPALAREEKRREEERTSTEDQESADRARAAIEAEGHTPTPAGAACTAIRKAGIAAVNPAHPDLLRLLAAGVTPQAFADTATELVARGKGKFPLLLATVEGRMRDAAEAGAVPTAAPDPMAWRRTSDGVFSMAERLGVKAKPDELFHDLERRVLSAFQRAGAAQASAA